MKCGRKLRGVCFVYVDDIVVVGDFVVEQVVDFVLFQQRRNISTELRRILSSQ